MTVGEEAPSESAGENAAPRSWGGRIGSISVDWWATLVAGAIAAAAVAGVLPKIPW